MFNHHMTFWNISINKFKCSSWTTFTGTMTTRMTNGRHYYHTNNRWGTGLGKGRDNRGSRSLRHNMSRASWYVFFFFFLLLLIFYLLNFYLHLELPWWRQLATTTAHHLHPQNKCRLEMHLCLKFWYVKFFFCPLLNDYIFLDCVYGTTTRMTTVNGHHLWDDEQGLETHHLCLESLVCFFYFFRYIFSFFFFIIISTYLNMSTTTTTTTLSNGSSCLECR